MSEKFTGGEKVHTEIRHEVNNQNENKSSSLESESGFSCCSLTCLSNMNRSGTYLTMIRQTNRTDTKKPSDACVSSFRLRRRTKKPCCVIVAPSHCFFLLLMASLFPFRNQAHHSAVVPANKAGEETKFAHWNRNRRATATKATTKTTTTTTTTTTTKTARPGSNSMSEDDLDSNCHGQEGDGLMNQQNGTREERNQQQEQEDNQRSNDGHGQDQHQHHHHQQQDQQQREEELYRLRRPHRNLPLLQNMRLQRPQFLSHVDGIVSMDDYSSSDQSERNCRSTKRETNMNGNRSSVGGAAMASSVNGSMASSLTSGTASGSDDNTLGSQGSRTATSTEMLMMLATSSGQSSTGPSSSGDEDTMESGRSPSSNTSHVPPSHPEDPARTNKGYAAARFDTATGDQEAVPMRRPSGATSIGKITSSVKMTSADQRIRQELIARAQQNYLTAMTRHPNFPSTHGKRSTVGVQLVQEYPYRLLRCHGIVSPLQFLPHHIHPLSNMAIHICNGHVSDNQQN